MSTLNGLVWNPCTDLTLQVKFPAHTKRKHGARVRMNAAAHQEKEKNKKTGKREAKTLPSAVFQKAAQRKNSLYKKGGPLGRLGKAREVFAKAQPQFV